MIKEGENSPCQNFATMNMSRILCIMCPCSIFGLTKYEFFEGAPTPREHSNEIAKSGLYSTIMCLAAEMYRCKASARCTGMNSYMWQRPITTLHFASSAAFGITLLPPIFRTLVCGDEGMDGIEEAPNIGDI